MGQQYIEKSTVPIQAMTNLPPVPTTITLTLASTTATIPTAENITVASSSEVRDQYGYIMTGQTVTYSIEGTYTGVSIDGATGVVTITPQAQVGVVSVKAECGTLSDIKQLTLTTGSTPTTAQLNIITNQNYNLEIKTTNTGSFTNKQFTLTYDANDFDIDDLCALTYTKETTVGAISGANINIISISSGSIVFEVLIDVPTGKKWSGSVNVIGLKAKRTGSANITLSIN